MVEKEQKEFITSRPVSEVLGIKYRGLSSCSQRLALDPAQSIVSKELVTESYTENYIFVGIFHFNTRNHLCTGFTSSLFVCNFTKKKSFYF
jgi:hypothetical protein